MSDIVDDSDGEHRRKRIRQACLNCRKKKVRCGGEKPVCMCCSRLSQVCRYVEDGRSQRRTSFSLNGMSEEASDLIVSTISSKFMGLEDRLSKIEDTLQRLEPLLSSLAPPTHLMNLMNEHPYHHRPNPAGSADTNVVSASMPNPQPDDTFPPIETLLFAADVFFRFCHNQPYSLFHEATFRQRLVSGELRPHLVWALLAAARRYSSLPNLQLNDPDDAQFYAKKAWDCMKLPWSGGVSDEEVVPILQTIILIVNVEHPSGLCASAYMKLGFAIRLVLHSKLHLEPEGNLDPIFREERKRTFWSIYLQDKLISLSRERFSILRDEECRIQLPSSEVAFREGRHEEAPTLQQFTGDCLDQESADTCCPLALIAVMASILSRVSYYVLQENRDSQLGLPWSSTSPYASISSTLLQLEICFGMNEDPKITLRERCYIDESIDQHLAGPFIYSKALFHLSHCLLHHPFLIQQRLQKLRQRAPPIFINTAWKSCRAHAKRLIELKDTKHHNVLVLTSLYGYCTMVAGTIHVLSMNDDDQSIREQGQEYYNSALDFLNDLSCYWKHAALMANRLERFRQQCENRRTDMNPCADKSGHSPGDVKALWQSVDYALLSAPTRPGSPTNGQAPSGMDLFTPQSKLFDFADFDTFAEGLGIFSNLPVLENKNLFPDLEISAQDDTLE
ncbi:fungal-specific transcription factor domain-containing protein [Fusarium solani]|uniref:Fungal-specific transcription factor domain-containing protein n=1 Tax=Fusarium solani TaxID=169388 RepID=A0A9P9KU42_FUSSL|nr:fungal-specific transcription factor domain-containing protein [Fusarium solani]KAH7268504.1 fungal-specific transcription factor domain-containing protein [Fusarium solani]